MAFTGKNCFPVFESKEGTDKMHRMMEQLKQSTENLLPTKKLRS